MITAKITNIVLEKDKFRVFYTLSNWVEENNLFDPNMMGQEIQDYIKWRIEYYNELIAKEEELKNELLEITL